jgi:hypothetical protein
MTKATAPDGSTGGSKGPATVDAADDVRLARVHLRMGQLTLARAELEDLLRRDLLDTTSLAVLAEARWRTGDGRGAADAAEAHLAAGGSDDVAVCIAAEAAALDGRQEDARELMDRLPAADAAALDALFAGMPRRAYWPAGPVEREDAADLRRPPGARDAVRRPGVIRTPGTLRGADDPPTQLYRQADLDTDEAAAQPVGRPPAAEPPRAAPVARRRGKGQLDPTAELALARAELDQHAERAFLRLALVLRHDPTLAPAVLDVLHLRREPAAALLRGDAQRLLGRHLEAEAAFNAAAESLEAP